MEAVQALNVADFILNSLEKVRFAFRNPFMKAR